MRKNSPSKKTKKSQKTYNTKEFLIDCFKNDMYYGALVRSPSSYGKITNISLSNIPEGYFLYTARDIPGINSISSFNVNTEIFCSDEVHYLGEPVGILIGPDIKEVRKIANEIQITFDISTIKNSEKEYSKQQNQTTSSVNDIVNDINTMPSLDCLPESKNSTYTDPEQIDSLIKSIQNTTVKIENKKIIAERKVNTGFFSNSTQDQIEKHFSEGDYYIVKDEWEFSETIPNWEETSGALSYFDGQTLTILTPTQWTSHLQKSVCAVLNINDDFLEIKKTISQQKKSSSTWRSNILAIQAAVATFISRKPVKLLLTKKEQELYMQNGIKLNIQQTSRIKKDGKIESTKITIQGDVGYSNPFAQEIADLVSISSVNLYDIENLSISTKLISTHNPPTSFSTETVSSGAYFAIENHIEHIADTTGILPDELRLLNISTLKTPFKYKNINYEQVINTIIQKSDFHRKYSSFRLNSLKNSQNEARIFQSLPQRGIALSCIADGTYFLGSTINKHDQKLELTLEKDGTVTINAFEPSQTIAEIWKSTASELLQIDPSSIKISSELSTLDDENMPEFLNGNLSVIPPLITKCCAEISKKRFLTPLPITSKKTIPLSIKKQWSKENFSGFPFLSSTFGAAIVEVEINPQTYKQTIKEIWIALDCGQIKSIKAAENAVKKEINQELELLVQNDTLFCPKIKIIFIQSNNPPSQINSVVHNLIPAAYTAAISQSISLQMTRIPHTQEEIFEKSETIKIVRMIPETEESEDKKLQEELELQNDKEINKETENNEEKPTTKQEKFSDEIIEKEDKQ